MVDRTGFEPMALSSANSRSIQLSYRSIVGLRGGIRTPDPKFRKLVFYPTELPGDCVVVPRRIELLFAVWKTAVLTTRRRDRLVEDTGLEPATSWMQIRRSPRWANPPNSPKSCCTIDFSGVYGNSGIIGFFGAASRIRTADLLITNQLLYQLSYRGLKVFLKTI